MTTEIKTKEKREEGKVGRTRGRNKKRKEGKSKRDKKEVIFKVNDIFLFVNSHSLHSLLPCSAISSAANSALGNLEKGITRRSVEGSNR